MRISRNMSGSKGATVVEFALVLPLFCFLVFGAIEFGWYFFVRNTVQSATRDGTRLALVGMQLQDPNNPGQMLTRQESIKKTIRDNAAVAVNPAALQIYIYAVNPYNGYQDPQDWDTYNAEPQGGDYMRVRTRYTFNFLTPIIGQFFPGGQNVIQAEALYRNERFN